MASDTHIDPARKAAAIAALRAGELSASEAARAMGCSRAAITQWAQGAGFSIARARLARVEIVLQAYGLEPITKTYGK